MTYVYGRATARSVPSRAVPATQQIAALKAELAKTQRRLEQEQEAHEKTRLCKERLRAELTEERKVKPAPAPAPDALLQEQVTLLTAERDQAVEAHQQAVRQLDAMTESYDTLTGINQGLTLAAREATTRAQTAEQDAKAARAQADKPSLVKILTEERETLTAKCDRLTQDLEETRQALRAARAKAHRDQVAATAGLVITIGEDGMELHGSYRELDTEIITGTLDRAFWTYARKSNGSHIADARR